MKDLRKFIIKFAVFSIIVLSFFIVINVVIDPYNIFHYEYPRNNGIEANKNFIKTRYLINHKDEFDSLLFGSSRAGFTDVEALPDGKYYNLCSSEAVPAEHVRLLKILIRHGFVPKNVTVMMDDISCFVDPAIHDQMLYRLPYPDDTVSSWFDFYVKYCDILTTWEAWREVKDYEPTDDDYTARFRRSGSERLNAPSSFHDEDEVGYWADYYELRIDEVMADIKELKQICEDNNITLRIVTNPLYYKTYQRDIENGYIDFLYALAGEVDYWNFSSFSEITMNEQNYYETSHFVPAVSYKMMDVVYYDKVDQVLWDQGFGVKVSRENRDEFIYFLKFQAEERGVVLPGE
ncbi:MAG: hypothetical protein IKP31_01525 [Lachnospiraceae bacterium]|nr:hypothetical protein [Lachnospiraceae bacterium]